MGLYANAELVWGIPVLAYDEETGDPTPFWDEENEDWREFQGDLEVHHYGHFEDPDNTRGILTSSRVQKYRGDCWDPTRVKEFGGVKGIHVRPEDRARAETYAAANGLDLDFHGDADWWLVASYG